MRASSTRRNFRPRRRRNSADAYLVPDNVGNFHVPMLSVFPVTMLIAASRDRVHFLAPRDPNYVSNDALVKYELIY